jgi:aquaporin Z
VANRTGATHWREYVSEAVCLGSFMCSAAAFATVLQHPSSPLALAGSSALTRVPMGVAMALTAMVLIYSAPGRRSGAHMNPVVTLTFLRLGKIAPRDAAMYVLAQIGGGIAGILLATVALAKLPADPSVNFVATLPGPAGSATALVAEAAISFGLMFAVLVVSNDARFNRFTGVCAGMLVCLYIVFEAPLSGMSMNPARTFGPALLAGTVDTLWIYVAGPAAGMLLAAETYLRLWGPARVRCAKFDHPADVPCIFRCGWRECTTPKVLEGIEGADGHTKGTKDTKDTKDTKEIDAFQDMTRARGTASRIEESA